MRTKIPSIVIACLGLASPPVAAMEAAGMRALQQGPIGEGAAFAVFGPADGEIQFRLVSLDGDERYGDATNRIEGQTTEVTAATGFAVNPELNFVLQMTYAQIETTGDLGGDAPVKTSLTSDVTELTAGPSLWLNELMLGAHASILSYGQQVFESGDAKTTTGAVTMPRLRLFAGFKSGAITAMARMRLYNDARTDVKGSAEDGSVVDGDTKRRSPAETSLDARLQLDKQLVMAGSFTYVGAGKAFEDTQTDYFVYGAGGLYAAAPWLTLAGGMHYTQPHYRDDADASIFEDNVGGLRLDIGMHYGLEALTANFDLGYTIPSLITYRDAEAETDVKLERSVWDLAVGMTLNF